MNTKGYKKNNNIEKESEKIKITEQISKNIDNADSNHENNIYLLLNTKLTTIDFNDSKNNQLSFYHNYKQQKQDEVLIINVNDNSNNDNDNNNNNIDIVSNNEEDDKDRNNEDDDYINNDNIDIISDNYNYNDDNSGNSNKYIILENNNIPDDVLKEEMKRILYQKNIINITSNYIINKSSDDEDDNNFSISLKKEINEENKENQDRHSNNSNKNKNTIKEQYNKVINSTIKKGEVRHQRQQKQIYYGDYFICPKEEVDNEEDLKGKSNQYTIGFIVDMEQWLNDEFIIVPSELVYVCLDFKKIIFPLKENSYHCQLYKENAPVKIVAKIENTSVFWL